MGFYGRPAGVVKRSLLLFVDSGGYFAIPHVVLQRLQETG